jgi:DNA-binding response OmpR family regulator
LVVEDDEDVREAITEGLRAAGMAVDAASDWPDADLAASVHAYDCMVLDRMLPTGDSLSALGELRRTGWKVPVLFLTARGGLSDRVAGFEHGGDDYLVKPFALEELVVRVRSLARRKSEMHPHVLRNAGVEADLARHQVRRDGVLLSLAPREFAVLERLLVAGDRVVTRTELIESCWDEMADPVSNVVDVVVARLRRKLGDPPLIHTVRGVGFRLTGTGP